MAQTREEINAYKREYRRKTNNADTKKYEKTPNGFLMRCYRNMKSRVTGVQKAKLHLYEGKELLDKHEFYEWAKGCSVFWELFKAWEASGYERRLTPSVDRLDSSMGYHLDNMEWVTHSENSRRGSFAAKRKREEMRRLDE